MNLQGPLETKFVTQSGVSIFVTLVTWLLVTYIPGWQSGIPAPIAAFIPGAVAWLIATYAGWKAPHTHRPDLLPGLADTLAIAGQSIARYYTVNTPNATPVQPGPEAPSSKSAE